MSNEEISQIYQLGKEDISISLNNSGYNTVFDICKESFVQFSDKNNSIPLNDLIKVYKLASERVENLQMLYNAWQIHNDPIVKNIKKLSSQTNLKSLDIALEKFIGGGSDFDDLFPERSKEGYAEATSIQSLFSPGRYLVVLYKIAKQLINEENERNIDNRRPDLKNLVLSTNNMNREVSSLDILLNILKSDRELSELKDIFYPMNLPYDDDLTQIRAVAESKSTNLINIWDSLLDKQREAFIMDSSHSRRATKARFNQDSDKQLNVLPRTRELLMLTPNSFNLIIDQDITLETLIRNYGLSNPDHTWSNNRFAEYLSNFDNFSKSTNLNLNQTLNLTGQLDIDNYDNGWVNEDFGRYFTNVYGSQIRARVSVYGARFLSNNISTSLLLRKHQTENYNFLNFDSQNIILHASRAEKLIRLANCTNLSFEELDWIITNSSMSIHGNFITLDEKVLAIIAEFIRLNNRYNITLDMYVAFINNVNIYTEKGQKSFYEKTFSSADNLKILPIWRLIYFPTSKQGLYESICRRAMCVTEDEFTRIGGYCFGADKERIMIDNLNLPQLYRMGIIPKMLGLNFTEAEVLWKLMDSGNDKFINIIAKSPSADKILEVIRFTETIVDWMKLNQLDVLMLQALITDEFSGTATPEIYNFLIKIYESSFGETITYRRNRQENNNGTCVDNLYQVLASEFNLKPNVMAQILNWIEKTDTNFSLQKFFKKIEEYFKELIKTDKDELDLLEKHLNLVEWVQKISQYVLIVQKFGLTEQDLQLLINHPEQVFDEKNAVLKPSLYLLLVLSRLKEWQQRVQVSVEEAMRYFGQIRKNTIISTNAISLLAHIHNWNEEFAMSMNEYLFGENNYPKNFEQIFILERWVNLGNELNIGSRTLGDLAKMSENDHYSESPELISRVAQNLIASI